MVCGLCSGTFGGTAAESAICVTDFKLRDAEIIMDTKAALIPQCRMQRSWQVQVFEF